jgi:hypothetical protein
MFCRIYGQVWLLEENIRIINQALGIQNRQEDNVKKNGFGCTTIVFLFALAMGGIWLYVTINGMKLAEASSSWPSTTGIIADTWIDRETSSDADGDVQTNFKPHVRYNYEVNGGSFHSTRVDFGPQPSYSSSSRAEDYLSKYPVGSAVEVFYNPEDFGDAVLLREASGSTISLIGSIVFIIFSVVGWVSALIKKRRAPTVIEDFISA